MNKPSVKKNFIYSTAYQILTVITPFITAPYISRVLGAEGVGIQSFTASIQTYFIMFAALGTVTYGTREISRNRDDKFKRSKLFWEIELLTVVTTCVCLLAWLLFIILSKEYKIYYIVLTLGLIATLFDISWFFAGVELFKFTVIRNAIFKILGIVAMFIFVKDTDDTVIYVFINSLVLLLSSLSLWPYLKGLVQLVPIKELRFKNHFKETLVYFVPTIATSIYGVLDRTLIGTITKNTAENGYYQQAEKIINIAKSVVFTSINSVVGARISYLFSENRINEIHSRIENSLNYIFFMGFGCCFGIIGVAQNFVPFFFGEGYEPVVYLLYVFSPILVIIGISNCLGSHYYTPAGKRALSAKFLIIGSVVNLCLNLFLIPHYGSYGAAIASVIAELIITCLYIRFSNGFGSLSMVIKLGSKKFLSGLLMCATVLFMSKLAINDVYLLLIQTAAGILVYIIILLILQDKWVKEFITSSFKKYVRRK